MIDVDPIDLIREADAARKAGEEAEAEYRTLCRSLFSSGDGKRWLRLCMARMNYMGSVFSSEDSMRAVAAAYRDGARSVMSDILNSAALATRRKPSDPDPDPDDEDESHEQ